MPIPDLKDLPVLVTGGAGFIGSHLVDELLVRGARVRVLDNLSTGRLENLSHCRSQIEWVEGDLRDAETCRVACAGSELVFHQAALGSVPRSLEDPVATLEVNAMGSTRIFEAARRAGARRVIYASSSSVYGDSPDLPKREGEEGKPLSPYAASKQMTEELAAVYSRCYEMRLIGLRYFNVFGPRQDPDGPYAAVIPRFFRAALEGRPMRIHGDGEQSRDFTFVSDAVRANLIAAGAPDEATGRSYNVASGRQVTVRRLAGEIASLLGAAAEPEHGPPRPGDLRHSLADLTLARRGLGYAPETGLGEGLAACRGYYEKIFGRERNVGTER